MRGLAVHTEGIALNAFVALLVLFAVLRDSDTVIGVVQRVGLRALGPSGVNALAAAARAIRAMFWVIVAVSIAESAVLVVIFLLAGLPHPVGFGALGGLASLIPGVTLLVVLGASAWLALQHSVAWAIAVAGIGLVLSGVADHLVKPLIIGRMAGLPVILALLSMLIGALSLGLVGIFLGPGIAAALLVALRAD